MSSSQAVMPTTRVEVEGNLSLSSSVVIPKKRKESQIGFKTDEPKKGSGLRARSASKKVKKKNRKSMNMNFSLKRKKNKGQ